MNAYQDQVVEHLEQERDAALVRADAAEAAVSRMIDQCVQAGRDRDSEWDRAQAALAEVERLREGLRAALEAHTIITARYRAGLPHMTAQHARAVDALAAARQLLGETD